MWLQPDLLQAFRMRRDIAPELATTVDAERTEVKS